MRPMTRRQSALLAGAIAVLTVLSYWIPFGPPLAAFALACWWLSRATRSDETRAFAVEVQWLEEEGAT